MKKRKSIHHDRRVTVCLSTQDFEKVQAWASETTSQTISEYIRNVITKKPVTFRTRNQTAEDFLEEVIELKNQFISINDTLTETVINFRKLPERVNFNTALENLDATAFSISQKAGDIRNRMNQIYQLWSQK